MKTLVNHLKFGALLTGFIFFMSVMGDSTMISVIEKFTALNGSPAISQTSPLRSNQVAVLAKRAVHKNHILTALPISFGTSEATLISN